MITYQGKTYQTTLLSLPSGLRLHVHLEHNMQKEFTAVINGHRYVLDTPLIPNQEPEVTRSTTLFAQFDGADNVLVGHTVCRDCDQFDRQEGRIRALTDLFEMDTNEAIQSWLRSERDTHGGPDHRIKLNKSVVTVHADPEPGASLFTLNVHTSGPEMTYHDVFQATIELKARSSHLRRLEDQDRASLMRYFCPRLFRGSQADVCVPTVIPQEYQRQVETPQPQTAGV